MPSDCRWSDTDRALVSDTIYGALPDDSPDTIVTAGRIAAAVLDALTAAGWRPPPPKLDGIHWRTGTSVGRTIYNPYGDLAGLMHTAEQARAVVAALNAAAEGGTDE